jgi:Trypsin-co-occurring domain 1
LGSRLLSFPVSTGTDATVIVEVQDETTDNVPVGREAIVERASRTFEEVIAQIKPAIEVVAKQLQQLSVRPEHTSIEFGIKLSAGADAWIAKTALEGNLKVTFTFK